MILLSEDHGAVRVLTMNRPEVRNALSTELFEALFAALGRRRRRRGPAVVLTGADPAFCAGSTSNRHSSSAWTTSAGSTR